LPTGKHGGIPSREERELDCHRAELQRLLATARQAKLKYKSSKIPAVPPGMAWMAKPMVLLNSRLWKSLGIYERRFLEALEIEHCRHAGKENGFLILTYDQATQHGIKRSRFVPTRDRLVELRLIEITHYGKYREAARSDPNRYPVTYLMHKLESASGAPSYVQAQHNWGTLSWRSWTAVTNFRRRSTRHRAAKGRGKRRSSSMNQSSILAACSHHEPQRTVPN
jgi:hypothetical protein